MRIATGEETETIADEGKNAAAVALGKRGGKARAERRVARGDREEGRGKVVKSRIGLDG